MYYPLYIPSYTIYFETRINWLIKNNIDNFIEIFENFDSQCSPSKIFFMTEEEYFLFKLSEIHDKDIDNISIEEFNSIISLNQSNNFYYHSYLPHHQVIKSFDIILNEIRCNNLSNMTYSNNCQIANASYSVNQLERNIDDLVWKYNNDRSIFYSNLSSIFSILNKKT